MKKIGVLAMQGAVDEHLKKLKAVGAAGRKIRSEDELDQIDGIIIPGGESTAIGKLLEAFGLMEPLHKKIDAGMPVWGTCAGMILLAKHICDQKKTYLNAMDILVRRNAYGGQLDSFTAMQRVKHVSANEIPMVFIRAPYIDKADKGVEILAETRGHIIAAKQKNMLATSFHPELTADNSFHKYFVELC
ncbi:pyridoxal 5'-phosphate synthase glutaminase subunit PdxT [Pectinatus haikarae]|uniref:Pyridoxal 5'-phosphate synthase subunit PdxT n=1 Tax=Pectinatus haikarae TaxID=349096 RepID=A0ABT9Y9L9_9FIRM|nr:pyridoxal 5'-phosphate synthase glutaminase subunit PdxT [Pectinatus haikarae]MDQ0204226.1 5'-phosphate synthase pdxT subunit [Pectinatus haikarae]